MTQQEKKNNMEETCDSKGLYLNLKVWFHSRLIWGKTRMDFTRLEMSFLIHNGEESALEHSLLWAFLRERTHGAHPQDV